MNALGAEIARVIRRDGPISVARYTQLCMTHPQYGYYMRRDPFGAEGDFTTAPEISQMFGEMIGLWCASMWQRMGSPPEIELVELGPGRGTLMADALRAAKVLPGFLAALKVCLIEASPYLREMQRARLADTGIAVRWAASLDEVAAGPAIFLANEFFDALPVRQFVRGRTGWQERLVRTVEDGRLEWCLDSAAVPMLPGLPDNQHPGIVAEISPEGLAIAFDLGARVVQQGGAALIVDYGDRGPPLGDTLQAVRKHDYADPLLQPGEADLSTQVRFEALGEAARAAGAAVTDIVPQGLFLERLGLRERAARLSAAASVPQRAAIADAVRRLTDAQLMGTLFKVMAITSPEMQSPAGFD